MKVVLRADASLKIGTGHIMRCLTLADALAARGADCQFICRETEGDLIDCIQVRGYFVHRIPGSASEPAGPGPSFRAGCGTALPHSHWLDTTQEEDARACASVLSGQHPDWLIVDHYALDANWECILAEHCDRIMAIDDLADRPHHSAMLLDQTFGRKPSAYKGLVPPNCHLLCGSQYALLRPDFAALRDSSLRRRANPKLAHLLISMGGVDQHNATARVLSALRQSPLPVDLRISVVMGPRAPWLSEVRALANSLPCQTRVLTDVRNMGTLMAECDLAIGAMGTTTWERCCLGLPTLAVVLADNQRHAAERLASFGAIQLIPWGHHFEDDLAAAIREIVTTPRRLAELATLSSEVTDGLGTERVVQAMMTLTPL